jgi:hypothetical protein
MSTTEEKKLNILKELAPAAFRTAEQGAENGVSKQYQFMTTAEIIDGLSGMGWNADTAMQQKSKKNPETTKHMIRFRHKEFGDDGINGNVPEILFVNSHDRTCSLNFHVGIFRTICSNGLIVADTTFSKFRVRHMGTKFSEVKHMITTITENLPTVFNTISKFQDVTLNDINQQEFAMRAFAIRFPEYIDVKTNQVDYSKVQKNVDVEDILKYNRIGDIGDDLWRVFNRVQENIIKGGFQHIGQTNKAKATRPLTNIRMNMIVNKGIWQLAEEFAQ